MNTFVVNVVTADNGTPVFAGVLSTASRAAEVISVAEAVEAYLRNEGQTGVFQFTGYGVSQPIGPGMWPRIGTAGFAGEVTVRPNLKRIASLRRFPGVARIFALSSALDGKVGQTLYYETVKNWTTPTGVSHMFVTVDEFIDFACAHLSSDYRAALEKALSDADIAYIDVTD